MSGAGKTAASASLRRRLVDELGLDDPRVRDAFLRVPRELFLADLAHREGLDAIYRDEAIVTKRDERGTPISSSSQPRIMAAMLERLELEPGLRVLEIGAGTGYNAALLKTIVGPRGRVVSVDVDAAIARSTRRVLREAGYAVRVVRGDGRAGHAAAAPYDRIVATVAATEIPRAWRDQLVEGGLLELPLVLERGEQVVATFRRERNRLRSVAAAHGGFMQLRGTPRWEPPALSAHLATGDAQPAPLVAVRGPAIGRLPAAARRRLLALLLGEPRRVPLPEPLPRWSLRLHLALELPEAGLVESAEVGIGLVDAAARSLALADTGWPARTETARHLLAFGADEAERRLARAVEAWRRRGCPGPEELDLVVEFGRGGSTVTRTWQR